MEGQCLGLIRDGNSATIVDVVPNSLAARHGLPPKVVFFFFINQIAFCSGFPSFLYFRFLFIYTKRLNNKF